MFYRQNRRILVILLLMIFSALGALELRSIWVTPWDLTSPNKIDQLIQDCVNNNINEILAEVRYRGDALYQPNRVSNAYNNPETASYILDDKGFDPLLYLIQKAKANSIKVQGWVVVFAITPGSSQRLSSNHLYFTKPDWITYSADGVKMATTDLEGAYIDPFFAEAREYLANVFADLVQNYDLDGLHLDYIRYPNHRWGFHPNSLKAYEENLNNDRSLTWEMWKEQQVTATVKLISERIKAVKPHIELSAAVKPDPLSATKYYGQNWQDWLDKKYIDTVYLMAYQTKDQSFVKLLEQIPEDKHNQIVVGLRAWSDSNPYPAYLLRNKTVFVIQNDYKGVSFFSYEGIRSQSYFTTIKPLIQLFKNNYAAQEHTSLYNICGKVKGLNGKAIQGAKVIHHSSQQVSYTDNEGIFTIYRVNKGETDIKVEYKNQKSEFKAKLFKDESFNYNNIFVLDIFPEESLSLPIKCVYDNKNIYLFWSNNEARSFALYRKKIASPNDIIDTDFQFVSFVSSKYYSNAADDNRNIFYYIYIDKTAEPFAHYEYRLIDNELIVQGYVRGELDFTPQPLEFSFSKENDTFLINMISEENYIVNWSILDMQGKPLYYGINQANADVVKWNSQSSEGDKILGSLFIFEYQVKPANPNSVLPNNNKYYRQYIY
ncbi:MAG TPA: family 10 glycosylhydrolase [Candidatus Cloacimonadota bacterium]|nr:family 10 glycosylhydrolase [Candidatus Cloacimonadota bacterium]